MRAILKRFDIRVSLGYAVVAVLWVVLSDSLLHAVLGGNAQLFATVGSFKGIGFVMATTLILFAILHAEMLKRSRIERELNQERTMLRTLIDQVPDYIFVKDRASRYMLSNLAHARAAGVSEPSELIGKTAASFFPAEYVIHHNADDEAVLNGASIIAQERQSIDAQGQSIWVSTTKIPLLNGQQVTGIVGISRNITDRKAAEEALKLERNRLRALIDAVPANVYIKDSESRFVDANAETVRKLGLQSTTDLLGKSDFDFFPSEIAAKYFADERVILQSGQPMLNIEELGLNLQTQETLWLLTTKAPVRDAYGQVIGLVGVGLDITERKRAEEVLRQNEAKLQTFFTMLPVGVSILNDAGEIIEINPALAQILNLSTEEISRGTYRQRKYIHSDGSAMLSSDFPSVRARNEQRPIHDSIVGVVKEDDRIVWTSVSAAPLPGVNSGVITVMADITERKQAETQAFALAAERQRVQLLQEFITDVSHDFRTPLTVIGTCTFLIGKATEPLKRSQLSQRIEDQVMRLRVLLDSFVELAHLAQQASSVSFQPEPLDPLVQSIVHDRRYAAEAKHQQLDYRCAAPSARVLMEPAALQKAVVHILTNAIQYTSAEGEIHVQLYTDQDYAVIEVRDTGIGIHADALPHVFECFYRADTARSLDTGGAGLGLSIAQKIITLMHGRIEVESELGVGTVVRISLPLYPS